MTTDTITILTYRATDRARFADCKVAGVFAVQTLDRAQGAVAKAAGFWFHGDACRSGCAACAAGLSKPAGWGKPAWWYVPADARGRVAAEKLANKADDAARAQLAASQAAVAASRATDRTDVAIPCPENLAYLPYQKAGIAYALERRGTLIGDEMGLGKAQPIDARVMTPSGWRAIGELRVGDSVIGSNGRPTTVTGVYPRGAREIYRVTMNDGASTRCCGEHLWYVTTANDRHRGTHRVLTLDEIVAAGIKRNDGYARYNVPLVAPVERPAVTLPIDPYLLGALIANGCFGSSVRFSGGEDHVAEFAHLLPAGVTAKPEPSDDWSYRLTGDVGGRTNALLDAVRELGLDHVESHERRIPDVASRGSIEQRLALLQGLMDNDGTVSRDGACVEYNTTSPGLAADMLDLARSLGCSAWMTTRVPTFVHRGVRKNGRVDHRIRLAVPDGIVPFRLPRKLARFTPRTKYPATHSIADVTSLGVAETVCIAVAAPDHLYVTDDYILTHNTVQAIGAFNALLAQDPHASWVIVCPASLRVNWVRELCRWLVQPTSIHMVDGDWEKLPRSVDRRAHTVTAGPWPQPTARIVVVNYDRVRAPAMLDALASRHWDLLALDEAHFIKNPKAQRTVSLLGAEKKKDQDEVTGLIARARKLLFLTGTPLPNKPIELWPLLHALAPEQFGSWWHFTGRYCGRWQEEIRVAGGGRKKITHVDGATHLEELQHLMRSTCMVRRLKADVLTELPPKRRALVVLPTDGKLARLVEKERDAFDRVEGQQAARLERLRMDAEIADATGDAAGYAAAVGELRGVEGLVFDELSELRHQLALAKLPLVIDHLRAKFDEGVAKLVVFGHHRDVLAAIAAAFGEAAVVVHGGVALADRDLAVERFQRDPSVKLFVGGIMAAGVGLTLTASHYVTFAELDYVPANVTQAEDRCHRLSQRDTVFVEHLVLDGSLDARMAEMLLAKQAIADQALDVELVRLEMPEAVAPRAPRAVPMVTDRGRAGDAPARPRAEPADLPLTVGRHLKVARPVLYPEAPDAHRDAAKAAMQALRARCDGAVQQDGAGFSKIDAYAGHKLAALARPFTDGEVWFAKVLARRYRRQLGDAVLAALGLLDETETFASVGLDAPVAP